MSAELDKTSWVFRVDDLETGIPRALADGIRARIFYGQQVMVSVVHFEPNAQGKMHHHPEEQWGVLLQGSLIRIQGDEAFEMKPGHFWLTPGGVSHTIHAGPQGATVLDIFSPIRQEYTSPGEGFGKDFDTAQIKTGRA
jgi:quercetin dioxygenase-like cupin family protein